MLIQVCNEESGYALLILLVQDLFELRELRIPEVSLMERDAPGCIVSKAGIKNL